MAINPVRPGEKKTGGLLGAIGAGLGALGSIIAAPFTGGSSLLALPGLAGAGKTLGDIADPEKVAGGGAAISRKAEQIMAKPTVTSSDPNPVLHEAFEALNSPDVSDDIRSEYGPILSEAVKRAGRPRLS